MAMAAMLAAENVIHENTEMTAPKCTLRNFVGALANILGAVIYDKTEICICIERVVVAFTRAFNGSKAADSDGFDADQSP